MFSPLRNHRRLLCLPLVVGILAVTACGTKKSESSSSTTDPAAAFAAEGTPQNGGVLAWGVEAETDGLDPVSGRWTMSGHLMASAIFDPLVDLDANGHWQPYLAQSIEPNANFTDWTIKMRSGVKFHDGTELTAEAVANALTLQLSSAMTSAALSDITSVEVSGPLQVSVKMAKPWATFPFTLATQVGYIPAPSMLGDASKARTPIGTGPFVFQSWDYESKFRAARNPDYWGRDDQGNQLPYLDAIEFRPIPDPQSRTDALLKGDIDALSTVSASEIDRLQGSSGIKMLTYDKGEKQFVMLNAGKPPFDNLTARLAVSAAVDAQAIRDQVGANQAAPADQIWSPGQLGHRDDPGHAGFDLDNAKRLVSQYQTETGKALSFTYIVDETSDARSTQLLKQMWEAAGIQVEVMTLSQAADSPVRAALGNYEAIDWRFFGDPDPDTEAVFLSTRGIDPSLISLNFAQFGNAQIDAALERGRATTDDPVRDDAYAEVSKVLNENAPYVWLYRVTWAIASNERVNGYGPAVNGSIQSIGPKTWVARLWKGN